jgi:hypothetical protein
VVHGLTGPTLVTPSARGQERRDDSDDESDAQGAHSRLPAVVQRGRRRSGDDAPLEVPVLTVAVLVAFFALLTLADVLPGQSGAPGLVAPVR